MRVLGNWQSVILLLGDFLFLVAALWVTLFLRYGKVPTAELWQLHIGPFLFLFALWIVVFFIFDLYGSQRAAFRRKMLSLLLRAQLVNSILAVFLFYFIPFVGIAPKTNLFLNLACSLLAILLWRLYIAEYVYVGKPERIVFLGSGEEIDAMRLQIAQNPKYRLQVVDRSLLSGSAERPVDMVAVDLHSMKTEARGEQFYNLALRGIQFLDIRAVYEQIFDRIPVGLIEEGWVLEYIPRHSKVTYGILKRLMDIFVALPLFLFSLIFYPFVLLAVKMEDGGSLFVSQERVGKNGKLFRMYKFRSMTGNDSGKYGSAGGTTLRVTRTGAFLRKSRIDELPQLISVLRGDQSLVGPRPELPALADVYRKEIPYYDMRHIITPGLSGWAQIYHEEHPHHGTAVRETKDKLSYDLFYVKNRSFTMDLKIALKTIKTLLMRVGV